MGARSTGRRGGAARGAATRATYPIGSNAASFKPHSALACRSGPLPLPPMPPVVVAHVASRVARALACPCHCQSGVSEGWQRTGESGCVPKRNCDWRSEWASGQARPWRVWRAGARRDTLLIGACGAARGAAAKATRVRRVGTSKNNSCLVLARPCVNRDALSTAMSKAKHTKTQ